MASESPTTRSPAAATGSPAAGSHPAPGAEVSAPVEADDTVEPGREDDADSAIDSNSLLSTESLSESIYEYRRIHGRTYQASKTTEYWAPNDDQQNEGLDMLHTALVIMQNDKLFLAPIGDNPKRVLDVATGTGIWAIDFADQYPGAEVIGTDISPIQPSWIPPNLKFVIDDCLLDWTWPEDHFDFIHFRSLYGSITDWGELYKKAFRHLKPGGWLQDLEMDVLLQSDHVTFPEKHIYKTWGDAFAKGGEAMGKIFTITRDHQMRDYMEAAGFEDITEVKLKTPTHGWPKDKRLQQAGLLTQACLDQSLEGLAMFVLTMVLQWTKEEALTFVAEMRGESRKKSNCAYCLT